MDRELLESLNNLSIALERLSESLSGGEMKTDVGNIMQSGDFSNSLLEINEGIKSIKEDTKKILDNQETLIKLQKEQKSGGDTKIFEESGEGSTKKMIMDGVSVIGLIAGAILSIGLAFKIIGTVDFFSVMALSMSLPLIALAFRILVENLEGVSVGDIGMASLALIGMSFGIMSSSVFLANVTPVGIFQLITTVLIATAFGAAAFGLGMLLKSLSKMDETDVVSGSFLLPIVLVSTSIAIAFSSVVLQGVQPIGLFQALTVVLIAGAFGAAAFGLGKLIQSFKGIEPETALVASSLMVPVLVALSFAIVGASILFQAIVPIGLFQALTAIVIAGTFVILAYSIKPILQGVKDVKPEDMRSGAIAVLGLVGLVTASSWILQALVPVPLSSLLTFAGISISLGVSIVALALTVKAIDMLKIDEEMLLRSSIVILGLSLVIALSSHILGLGNYEGKYPKIEWVLGVGLSLAAFGIGALLLGTQAMNPLFYAGLALTLLVGFTIVAFSHIISLGNYDESVSPSHEWSKSTILLLGGFAALALGLSMASLFVGIGMGVALIIAGSIFLIDKVFSLGSYETYPSSDWSNSTLLLISKFALFMGLLSLISPLILLGTVSLMAIVGSLYLTDKVFSKGDWTKYPNELWQRGVTQTINNFSRLLRNIRDEVGFGDLIFGSLRVLGLAKTIKSIDEEFNSGNFTNFPSEDWVNGTMYALREVSKLGDEQSGFFGFLGDKFMSFIGGDEQSQILKLAKSIVKIDNVFSGGDFSKFPSKDWVEGTIMALSNFGKIKNLLNDISIPDLINDGMMSNITKLANSFEKLGESMKLFSDSIKSIDSQKLGLLKSMSNNVILLSLLDSDMLDKVLKTIEDRGGVFAELMSDFESKRVDSPSVSAIGFSSQEEESDVNILGDKLDTMTGLLADMSRVVGSRGTLNTYIMSIKDKQLSSSR
jgi:hypothetical protein